jgi:two-component sensor histidine kinase
LQFLPAMAFASRAVRLTESKAVSSPPTPNDEAALGLALAVVAASDAPLLLLDGKLVVVAASTSFCRAFQIDPARVAGREVFALGKGEWDVPRLRSLLSATLSGIAKVESYEMDLKRDQMEPLCLVLKAEKLAYGNAGQPRLLLAVFDVTQARIADKLKDTLLLEKDNLLRDKAVLLQELQHRVANSLQIIASVLMMSARKVQSEETRGHLHDAHNRVMSIAALQQQLAVSSADKIALKSYFTRLCQSLGASMIHDPNQIKLEVSVDNSIVGADASISLGLIVTELVINALKHAFPGDRSGKIVVDYHSRKDGWTMSVTDDGVGMGGGRKGKPAGLGTSLVEALAKQLRADVSITRAKPGTAVSVIHPQAADLSDDAKAIPVARAV